MLQLKKDLFADIAETPKEHYTFYIEPELVDSVQKKYTAPVRWGYLGIMVMCAVVLLYSLWIRYYVFWCIVLLVSSVVMYRRTVSISKKQYEKAKERYRNTLFDYSVYDDYLIVWISSDDAVKQIKIRFDEIKKAQIVGDLVVVEAEQLFLLKKDGLSEDSYFFRLCEKK